MRAACQTLSLLPNKLEVCAGPQTFPMGPELRLKHVCACLCPGVWLKENIGTRRRAPRQRGARAGPFIGFGIVRDRRVAAMAGPAWCQLTAWGCRFSWVFEPQRLPGRFPTLGNSLAPAIP